MILLVLLVLLAGLIALTPMLASTSFGRGLAVSVANSQLNGTVQIADWRITWNNGIEIHDLRIFHEGAQVLQADQIRTDLSFSDIARGNIFQLGQTTVQANIDLKQYANGETNFHRLLGITPSEEPLRVPDVTGTFDLKLRGTIQREQPDNTWLVMYLDPSTIRATITDINAQIKNEIDLAVRDPKGSSGRLLASGDVKLFHNHLFALDQVRGAEAANLQSFNLAAMTPLIGNAVGVTQLAGAATGSLSFSRGQDDAVLIEKSRVQVPGLLVAGPVLKGDAFKSQNFSIDIPPTRFDPKTQRLAMVDAGQNGRLTITMDQGSLAFSVDATLQSLRNAAAGKAPGSKGAVFTIADLDLAAFARQLPHLVSLPQDTRLETARWTHEGTITLEPDRIPLVLTGNLTNIVGYRGKERVAPKDITVSVNATSLGGGWPVPDLRDLSLKLGSGFGQIAATGPDLGNLQGSGQVQLADARKDLGLFVDLSALPMEGSARVDFTSKGNLAVANGSADARIAITTLDNVRFRDIQIARGEIVATGKLMRGADVFLKGISGGNVTAWTGNQTTPTLFAQATGDVVLVPQLSVPRFEIARAAVRLAEAQKEMPVLFQPLAGQQAKIIAGVATVQGKGSFDGKSIDATLSITPQGLGISRLIGEKQVVVLDDYNGLIELTVAANTSLTELKINRLNAQLDYIVAEAKDPIVYRNLNGKIDASGTLALGGDISRLDRLWAAWSGGQPGIYTGKFSLTERLSTDGVKVIVKGQGAAELALGAGTDRFQDKSIQIANDITLDPNARILQIQQLAINTQQTQAVNAAVQLTVKNYDTQRTIDGSVDIRQADEAVLLDMVRPLLAAEQQAKLKGLAVQGVIRNERFTIGGSFPTTAPSPLEHVVVVGRLPVEKISYQGLSTEQPFAVPFELSKGVVQTKYADAAASRIAFSKGYLSLYGAKLALTGDFLRVSMAKDTKVMENVEINKEFINQTLSTMHPVFAQVTEARGVMNLVVHEMNELPLGEGLYNQPANDRGTARFTLALTNSSMGGVMMDLLATQLKLQRNADGSIPGLEIPQAEFTVKGGMVQSNLPLSFGKNTLRFTNGAIRLKDFQIVNMTMQVPVNLIPLLRDQRLPASLNAIDVQVSGAIAAPKFDIMKSAMSNIQKVNPLDILKGQLDRQLQDKDRTPRQPGATGTENPTPSRDPLDLLRGQLDRQINPREAVNRPAPDVSPAPVQRIPSPPVAPTPVVTPVPQVMPAAVLTTAAAVTARTTAAVKSRAADAIAGSARAAAAKTVAQTAATARAVEERAARAKAAEEKAAAARAAREEAAAAKAAAKTAATAAAATQPATTQPADATKATTPRPARPARRAR